MCIWVEPPGAHFPTLVSGLIGAERIAHPGEAAPQEAIWLPAGKLTQRGDPRTWPSASSRAQQCTPRTHAPAAARLATKQIPSPPSGHPCPFRVHSPELGAGRPLDLARSPPRRLTPMSSFSRAGSHSRLTRPTTAPRSGDRALSRGGQSSGASPAAQPSESTVPMLFTAEQAAVILQLRPSWLRRKAAARAVPCRFVGKHLRFARGDLETIAEMSAQKPRRSS